jgi:hypothetical protein
MNSRAKGAATEIGDWSFAGRTASGPAVRCPPLRWCEVLATPGMRVNPITNGLHPGRDLVRRAKDAGLQAVGSFTGCARR